MGLMNKLCVWLTNKYPERSRTITRDGEPYLLRFYITKPRVDREQKANTPSKFGIYLHHFYTRDKDLDLHNHPWKWAVSFILSGWYTEQVSLTTYHIRTAGTLNIISNKKFHRIMILGDDPVWTLFIVGPRATSWGFKNAYTGDYWPWCKYASRNSVGDEVPCEQAAGI